MRSPSEESASRASACRRTGRPRDRASAPAGHRPPASPRWSRRCRRRASRSGSKRFPGSLPSRSLPASRAARSLFEAIDPSVPKSTGSPYPAVGGALAGLLRAGLPPRASAFMPGVVLGTATSSGRVRPHGARAHRKPRVRLRPAGSASARVHGCSVVPFDRNELPRTPRPDVASRYAQSTQGST